MNRGQGEENITARVARNTVALTISKIVQIAYGLLTASIIARYLKVELFGQYTFITAIIAVLIPFLYFGMQRIVIRDIARDKDKASDYFGAALILRTVLSLLMIIGITVTLRFINLPREAVIAIYIFAFSEIFMSFADIFVNIYISFEKMVYDIILNIIISLSGIIAIVFVVYYNLGFVNLFLAILSPSIAACLTGYIITRKRFVRPKIRINYPLWRHIIKESFPLFISTLFIQAFLRVDVFILKALRNLSEVSLFFAPYTLTMRLQMIPQTIVMAFFPVLSRFACTSRDSLEGIYEKIFRLLFILSLPISVVTTVMAEKIILLFFGSNFKDATISLQILIWAVNLTFLETLLGTILISLNKQRLLSIIYALAFLANLLLDLILVPLYGYIGACIGSLSAEILRTGLTYYYVSRNTYFLPLQRLIIKPAISVVIMSIFIILIKNMNLFLVSSIGILIYLFTLFMVGDFSKDDIALFKRVLNRA
jgi:O-antigen/teichoic acid export membrane protein